MCGRTRGNPTHRATPGAPVAATGVGQRSQEGLFRGHMARRANGACLFALVDPVRRNPDIALAQKLLGGWTSQVPLERGLEATIAYFRGLNGRPQG